MANNILFLKSFPCGPFVAPSSALVSLIHSIVLGSAYKKMRGIYTTRIITRMANLQASRISSIKHNAKSVSLPLFSFKLKKAVSVPVRIALKFPTTIRKFGNTFEEIFSSVSFNIVRFGHRSILL